MNFLIKSLQIKKAETIPTIDEIAKFSSLFEDAITLDDLTVRQLQAFCKLLGIGFLGDIPSSRVLRFQIMMKVRELEVDDKVCVNTIEVGLFHQYSYVPK